MKYKLLDYHGESRDYMHLVIKVQIFQQIESSGILVSRCEIEDKSQLFSTLIKKSLLSDWPTMPKPTDCTAENRCTPVL